MIERIEFLRGVYVMLCEMCSGPNAVFKVDVEGSRLTVCEKCSMFGKVVCKVSGPSKKVSKSIDSSTVSSKKLTETVQVIKSDYALVIKQARERLGLKQQDFAKRLMEKESVLHNIESGHMKPDIALARKLEKALKVSLVEQVEVEVPSGSKDSDKKRKGEGLTIGDLITFR
jgi:putative transcription factor